MISASSERATARSDLFIDDTLCGRIPRKEVERVARTVMKELETIQPGCSHTIVGGYVWPAVPSCGGFRLITFI